MDIKKNASELRNFLLCAIFLRWVVRDKRGLNVYYSSIVDKEGVFAHPG
jgi:hypothetical protein